MIYLLLFDSLCILQLPFCSFLLYLHNILYTRISVIHICTSNEHVFQISSTYSYLSNIRQMLRHLFWVVFLPTCVHDLCIILLQLSLFLFAHIDLSIFFLYLFLIFHISLVFDTLARIRYDNCNSILCVLTFCVHIFGPPLYVMSRQATFIIEEFSFFYYFSYSLSFLEPPA